MADKPILFNGEMVRATLDGRKTQTRRVVKAQPTYICGDWSERAEAGDIAIYRGWPCRLRESTGRNKKAAGELTPQNLKCPYGKPGDRLWVRETWWDLGYMENGKWCGRCRSHTVGPRHVADCPDPFIEGIGGLMQPRPIHWKKSTPLHSTWRKRPSIHMPRWASRITLEITNIRVERVQDITVEDMVAEGIINLGGGTMAMTDCWITLWDSINEKRGFGWDKNPWVWVIEYQEA